MRKQFEKIYEFIRRCKETALLVFGFVMLLLTMWEVLREHLDK